MNSKRVLGFCIGWLISTTAGFGAPPSDVADAAMKGNKEAVRALLQQKANVNAPQSDGTTALDWAVRSDDLETADLLIRAGANVSAANRDGATPLLLASINGNAAMIEKLIEAGADPNASLTKYGDTALMLAARTGKTDAVRMLLDHGAQVNAKESWGDTTALMWAVSELHPAAVKILIDHGADVNARSKFVPSATGRGFEGTTPVASKPDQSAEEYASGLLTPLMFAAREGDVESARLLVAAGADVNAIDGDGKDVLGLAIFNGNYELASFLIDKPGESESSRRAGVHAAVLGGGSPQYGNASELPLDGDHGSSSLDREAAGRRSEPECPGQ